MKKFAVISPLLPPTNSGQPLVLYNILKNFAPEEYCLISEADYSVAVSNNGPGNILDCKYYYLRLFFNNYFFNRMIEKIILKLNIILPDRILRDLIDDRVKSFEAILKNENCEAVIACTGSIFDPVAAYYASRNLGIKFIFYIFDMYSSQFTYPEGVAFTKKYENILVKNADEVILTNEFVCNEYLTNYDVKGTIIHNPVPDVSYGGDTALNDWDFSKKNLEILYAGSIYAAHYDAFRNLVVALKKFPNFKLRIITSQRKFILRMMGIRGPVIYDKVKSQSEVFEMQKKADILFLPLAFDSPYPQLIQNSSPGKMGEYLASGKPVLLHAPADSFLSWYFRENNCGIVVDKNDPDFLAEKISEMIENGGKIENVVKNALNCAKKDFSSVKGYEKLRYIISS